MIDFLDDTALLLLQAAVQDTLIMRTVSGRGWFETITGVASGLISIALLVLTIALVPAAWNFRKSYAKINDLLDRVYGDINPIMHHASTIADNVNYITTAIRVDVQEVNRTVALTNRTLREAVSRTEQRMRELHALLDVAQEEAEDLFIATASTLRGMQRGAAALREQPGDPAWEEDPDGDDGLDPAAPHGHDLGEEELAYGDDRRTGDELRTPAPRVRARRRGGREL